MERTRGNDCDYGGKCRDEFNLPRGAIELSRGFLYRIPLYTSNWMILVAPDPDTQHTLMTKDEVHHV